MTSFRTQLSVLETSAAKYPSLPVLKIAQRGPGEISWKEVSFAEFHQDVLDSARYWAQKFSRMRLKERSVVGMWLRGMSYIDIVHIWGVARAGFIPQVVSFRITDPNVTYQLLDRGRAVALIHDPSFQQSLEHSRFPTWPAEDTLGLDLDHLALPELWMPSQGEDVTMIYHTSGSSSGSPKLVPVTATWLDASLDKSIEARPPPPPSSPRQEATTLVGAFSHMASPVLFISLIHRGGCLILPTELPYPIAELQQMIHRGGLTSLAIFSSYLSRVIQEARRDPSLLAALRDLDHVSHTGMPLDDADGAWGREQGINIENVFACTEVGLMLRSSYGGGRDDATPAMRPMSGSKYEFLPLSDSPYPGEELLELVVPPESPDCPAESLRSDQDGKYHTGDLFVEVAPGEYLPRGRNDDWIKMECSLRCDTGSIEKNAMECCGGDLISAVVAVGAGRPSPAMIVEPQHEMAVDGEDGIWGIKDAILGRIAPFHRRRYIHERIDDGRFILVVPKGTLPRTASKGNIQRKTVEERFKGVLDEVYSGPGAEIDVSRL